MKTSLLITVCAALLVTVALAEEPADAPAEEPAAPTKAAPAKPLPDLCKDAVDPYNAGSERGRFFAAAGKDSELTAAEAEANRKAPKPFVRRFDRWSSMIAFDKNGNKTLDWFEADAYRKGFRQRVLLVFDADKNSRLADKEREQANRALAAGKLPRAKAGEADRPPIWIPAPSPPAGANQEPGPGQEHVIKLPGGGSITVRAERPDQAGTGGSDARRERYRQMGEEREKHLLERHDTDGDGKLSDEERKAIQDQWTKRMEEWRQRRNLQRYDKNKDGKLDEEETAEQEKGQAEREKRAAEWRARAEEQRQEWLAEWDTDGDGELSDAERDAMRETYRKRSEERRKAMDADGDGDVSGDEARDYYNKIREKYDADGDGELSSEERSKMYEEEGYGGRFSGGGGFFGGGGTEMRELRSMGSGGRRGRGRRGRDGSGDRPQENQ